MSPKLLIGLALAAGAMLPGAAAAQHYDRNDPQFYRYYDGAGRLQFDRQAWRAHEERRKREIAQRRYRDDRRDWRRERLADRRAYRRYYRD